MDSIHFLKYDLISTQNWSCMYICFQWAKGRKILGMFFLAKKWYWKSDFILCRECPLDLKEAISSICFAAPRCADLPELLQVQMLFAHKYGKEFVAAAAELMPDCGVNRQVFNVSFHSHYSQSLGHVVPFVKFYLCKCS